MKQYTKYEKHAIEEWLVQNNIAKCATYYNLKNMEISGNVFIFKNLDIPYAFGDVETFYSTNQLYLHTFKLPRNANNIELNDIQYLTNLDLQKTFFRCSFTIANSKSIKAIQNIRGADASYVRFISLTNLEKITFSKSMCRVETFNLENCDSIQSLSQITAKYIPNLIIDSIHFKSFEKSKIQKINNFECNCYRLLNFRGVETLNIQHGIVLYNIETYNNIINLMHVQSDVSIHLSFSCDNTAIEDIMLRFVGLHNRSEYIMDCVLELIENDFTLGAEL